MRARSLAILTVLAVAAGLVAVPTAGRAASVAPGDWSLTRIQAGPGGAEVRYGWEATGRRVGSEPLILGTVRRESGTLTAADVYEPMTFEVPTDGMTLRTADDAGSLEVDAVPNSKGGYAFGQGKLVQLEANESATLVSFVGGASNTTVSVNVIVDNGSASFATTHGSGTQLLRTVDQFHDGSAVDAGYVTVGKAVQRRSVTQGIVGGFVRTCEECSITWEAPDGRRGATTQRGFTYGGQGQREVAGTKFFSGPAGTWTWTWEGIDGDPTASVDVLGAYAPVGAAWSEMADLGDFGGASKDWVLATVTAGPSGAAAPEIVGRGSVLRPSGSAVVFGVGRADGATSYVDADPLGDSGAAARSSDDLGALDVHVRAAPASEGPFEVVWFPGPMAPNEQRTLLLFAAGGVLTWGTVDATTDGGTLAVTSVKQGSGSAVVRAAGPGNGGTAVDLGRAQAGEGATTRSVSAGIAGGLGFRCDACTAGWTSPDGRSGSWTHGADGSGSGTYTFGGPAGSWGWTWDGLDVEVDGGAGLIGGYAPIGEDWHLFV